MNSNNIQSKMSFEIPEKNCLFCYNRISNIIHSEEEILTPEQIISSVNLHLNEQIIREVDWKTNSVAESFCRYCYDLTEKIFELNSHLEKLRININTLGTSLANRIHKQRKKHQLTIRTHIPASNPSTCENQINLDDLMPSCDKNHNSSEVNFENEAVHNIDDGETNPTDYIDYIDEDELDCAVTNVAESVDSVTVIESSQNHNSKIVVVESPSKLTVLEPGLPDGQEQSGETKEVPDFKCNQCHESFSRQSQLQRHKCSKPVDSVKVRTYVTTVKNQIKAAECSVKLKSGETHYKCEYCGRTFKKKSAYVPHVRKHERSQHSLTCEFCGKKLSNKRSLRRHLIIHQQVRPFNCARCNRGFVSNHALSDHLKKYCNDKPKTEPTIKYNCEACDEGFTTKVKLNQHLKTHLSKPAIEKSAAEKLLLEKIMQRQSYKCGKCEKSFWDRSSLSKHQHNRHTDKKVTCQRCHWVCRNEKYLQRHIERRHTCRVKRKRKIQIFTCLICQRGLSSAEYLLIHQEKEHTVRIEPVQPAPVASPEIPIYSVLGNSGKSRVTYLAEYKFGCVKCKIHFQNEVQCTNHEMKQMTDKNIIQMCHYCKKKFDYQCEFKIHHTREHAFTKPLLKCQFCERTWEDYEYLRTHVIQRHPTEIGLKPSKPIPNRRGGQYNVVKCEVITIDSDED